MSTPQLLMIEDDARLAAMVGEYLTQSGYGVTHAGDGESGLALLHDAPVDLVVLDLMLPGIDGLTLCRRLRQDAHSTTPVLMLTARATLDDKVAGFSEGADDYLTKPFSPRELVARIKAVLRRCAAPRPSEDEEETIRIGRLEVNQLEHKVSVGGSEVVLTLKEYELLRKFLQHPGIVFSRDKLLNDIWGYEFSGETRTVDVHIRTLRQKLGDAGELIETIRGVGYRMAAVK